MIVEISRTCYGSSDLGRVGARFPETAAVPARVRMMWSSVSVNFAPIARNPISPWMKLPSTAAISCSSPSKLAKQFERTIIVVECNKNRVNWLRFGEETWIWRFLSSCEFLKILRGLWWFWSDFWWNEFLLGLESDLEYICTLNPCLIHQLTKLAMLI